MEKIQQRERIYKIVDITALVVVFAIFAITFFLPKSGEKVLLTSALQAIALLLYGIFTLVKWIIMRKNIAGKNMFSIVFVIGVCLVIGGMMCKDVVMDMANGPVTETVTITSVTYTKNLKSFIKSYRVSGYDEDGNKITLGISEEDANKLASRRQATLKYYENSRKLIEIKQ